MNNNADAISYHIADLIVIVALEKFVETIAK